MKWLRLRCAGEVWGWTDGRILRVRCRNRSCRIDGKPVIHLFDLETGDVRTLPELQAAEELSAAVPTDERERRTG